jgi:hypothetical protein
LVSFQWENLSNNYLIIEKATAKLPDWTSKELSVWNLGEKTSH